MKLKIIALILLVSGTAWAWGPWNWPDGRPVAVGGNSMDNCFLRPTDNCAKYGLEHSWKYYRIWETGLVSCTWGSEGFAQCAPDYGCKEINYPSEVKIDLPHGDIETKIFRRACKNCKVSEDLRIIHKEVWEPT